MTEKRFTGEFDKQYSGVHDNGEQLTNFEVVDLLNNLSEDNEYLEKRFKEEEWHYDHIDEDRDVWKYKCQELEKENEELKLLVQNWEALDEEKDEQLDKQNQALKKLKKENEHIKNTIQEAYHNERTKLGQSVLKQLLNNIEAIQ